jgi:hypothetical protein
MRSPPPLNEPKNFLDSQTPQTSVIENLSIDLDAL